MTAVAFPNLRPSARVYKPGKFPQTEFEAQNGARTVVRFGDRRVDSSLSLSFKHISDEQAALILQNYEQVNRDWNYVTFSPTSGTAGAGAELAAYLSETGGSGLLWRYAEPPQVTSNFPGVSTVSCKFIGVLDGN